MLTSEATKTQNKKDWLEAHVNALEDFGCAPAAFVFDFVPRNKIGLMCPSSLCDICRLSS
jgi:hypothetical protein